MSGPPGAVAAIDCGTNSTRLLVATSDGTVLDRQMRITRLGEGVDATGVLSGDAVARTVAVLREYRAVMDSRGVVRARLVATSAARDAANADEFLAAARQVTGVAPEILSGVEEGALSFAGATADVERAEVGPGPVLVVDIGGGSTELVTGELTAGPASPATVSAVSLDVGCVRVTERFFLHDPPHPDGAGRRSGHRRRAIAPVSARAGAPGRRWPAHRAGRHGVDAGRARQAGGTLRAGRAPPRRARARHRGASGWTILAAEDRHARLARPGMVEGRADVIVGGVLILDAVMDVFDRGACLASEDDILDGLVASLV